jgi:ATP-dependent Clp protease, protease subunit
MGSIPYVIETEGEKERAYDLYSRLLKDRIIFIRGGFNEDMANAIVGQLLFLESVDPDSDIYMYINSLGGNLDAMLAIFDTMRYVKPDIVTLGIGSIMSAGSFILAAGTKGKRYALPNSQIMIHELSSGHSGKYNDLKNYQKYIDRLHNTLAGFYSELTGQKLSRVKKDMERDYYMTAEEAKEYGLIDEVQYERE